MLFAQSVSAAWGGIAGAFIAFLPLWFATRDQHLVLWLIAVQAASVIRLVMVRQYNRAKPTGQALANWFRFYLLTAAIVGFTWGFLPLIDIDTESTLIAAIPFLGLGFVMVGAIPAYSIRLSAYVVFLASMVLTSAIGLASTLQYDHIVMAVFLIVFSTIVYSTAARFDRRVTEALALTRVNDDLVAQMGESNAELESSNQALKEKQSIIDRETEIARHVFNQLIIPREDQLPEVTYWNQAYDNFSGDLVQTAEGPHGKRYMFLGDFTGHGLPAALGAVPTSSVFLAMTQKGLPVENIASELNSKLNTLLPTGYFCCAILMEDDPTNDIVRIVNAGLPPALVVDPQGQIRGQVNSDHLPLGVLASSSVEFKATELPLQLDDCCYIHSDGITDAQNPAQELWGTTRFHATLNQPLTGKSRINSITHTLLDFVDDAPSTDDISILEYRKLPLHMSPSASIATLDR